MRNYNGASCDEELYHHGIKGMRWGIRRFQNPDGSLTKAGIRRYGDKSPYEVRTSDGDTFHVSKGSKKNYNTRYSKVTKTWGQHNKEIDDAKANKQSDKPKSKHRQNLEAKYRAMGYDAVADLNDRKYSGYKAKSATIVFGGKGKMEVSAVKKLSDQEINDKYVKGMAMLSAPELAKAGALYVAAPMMASMTVNHIRAEKYRDEHPNTELTDKEIIKMLNEQTARGD